MTGIYRSDDTTVDYTPEVGKKVLGDPTNADVLSWVTIQAQAYDRYYTGTVKADAKNSSTGSSGKRAGAGKSKKTRS